MSEETPSNTINTNHFLEIMKMKMDNGSSNKTTIKEFLLITTLVISLMFLGIKYMIGSSLDDTSSKVAEELVKDIIQFETGIKINSN